MKQFSPPKPSDLAKRAVFPPWMMKYCMPDEVNGKRTII
jgi:hypothetical protein